MASTPAGGAPPSGYFDSPQTLARTAQKLAEKGLLDEAGAESVQQCIRAYHDHVDDEALLALQPHIPAGITDTVDAQYAVKELANIVSTSLANYARASSEVDRLKATETIQSALVRRRAADAVAARAAAARNPVEDRDDDGSGGGGGGTRRTVVFSRLSPREKDLFMQFLVRNRVAFSKTGDEFVAAVRLIPKKVDVPPNPNEDSSLVDDGPPPANPKCVGGCVRACVCALGAWVCAAWVCAAWRGSVRARPSPIRQQRTILNKSEYAVGCCLRACLLACVID
jgi:hypothetical protein